MKRELFIHFSFWFSYFVLLTLFNQYFSLSYWPFWLGGLMGMILPDIDHLIYAYITHPQEFTSQRIRHLLESKNIKRSIELLYESRSERKHLVFHTIFFQLIFFVVLLWVLTSSGSLLGKGLALSFAVHLLVDQMIDITEMQGLHNWFDNLPFKMDFAHSKSYWIIISFITVILGILL